MNALIVFAKAPIPGRVKTRLTPPLSPGQAAELYAAFAADSVAAARACGAAAVSVAYAPEPPFPDLNWLDEAPNWRPQGPGDLGARLTAAFDAAFRGGARKVAIIGSDCPDLPSETLAEAFRRLDGPPAVLGPAVDGGYYLVGLREPRPDLFADMAWSDSGVLERTLARLRASRTPFALLERRADVDTFEDLKALASRLSEPSGRAPRAREALRRLFAADATSREEPNWKTAP
ncbi:MAG: TIGR04282 family arsenosugar biosynthesis glycosyltransferase [Elusimicrobia bacterium]|nr:TIGR04282 family arsenosugar biosynthesis glycosyltransferase [Elusimicrobiota bacterium]